MRAGGGSSSLCQECKASGRHLEVWVHRAPYEVFLDEQERRSCRGVAQMIRYADDFVVCFEHREEAERFHREVVERLAAFDLLTLRADLD